MDTYNILTILAFLLVAWISTIIVEFCYCEWRRGNYMVGIHEWKKIKHGWKGGDPNGKAQSSQEDDETRCTPSPEARKWWQPQDQ